MAKRVIRRDEPAIAKKMDPSERILLKQGNVIVTTDRRQYLVEYGKSGRAYYTTIYGTLLFFFKHATIDRADGTVQGLLTAVKESLVLIKEIADKVDATWGLKGSIAAKKRKEEEEEEESE